VFPGTNCAGWVLSWLALPGTVLARTDAWLVLRRLCSLSKPDPSSGTAGWDLGADPTPGLGRGGRGDCPFAVLSPTLFPSHLTLSSTCPVLSQTGQVPLRARTVSAMPGRAFQRRPFSRLPVSLRRPRCQQVRVVTPSLRHDSPYPS